MKKKIFTFFLALVASVGTMFASTQVDGIWYDFDSRTRTACVTYQGDYSYTYPDEYLGNVVIPSSVTYTSVTYSVTFIGSQAFKGCTGLTSVTIPESVTSIEWEAFEDCTGLTSFTIPNSITYIGTSAFKDCTGLTSITIPNSVTGIGKQAFMGCSGLTSVTIPNSVTGIGSRAFFDCTGLTSVTIEAETPPTWSEDGFFPFDELNYNNNYPIYVPCNAINVYRSSPLWRPYRYRVYVKPDCPNITVRLDSSSCSSSSWSEVYLWAWTDSGDLFDSWPGQVVGKDKDGWYSYIFDEDITSVNIIWNNGTDKTVNIEGVTSSTCYALNSTTGTHITVSVVNCPGVIPTQYTVVFKNWDGSVLQSMQVEEGQIPQYTGATPIKPDDAQYTYTFSGWTPQIVAATADATYTATFTATPKGQGIDDVQSAPTQCTKVIRDGQLFILRGDKTYTLQGQETIMP